MHIPQWRQSLREICQKLRPGGLILIVENNHGAVEMKIVRAIRTVRKSGREMRVGPDGYEFHDHKSGFAPLTRVANVATIIGQLQKNGLEHVTTNGSAFFDPNRFSPGVVRELAIRFNQWSRWMRCPARLCCENAIVGRKPT